jgi:hypothetical protein
VQQRRLRLHAEILEPIEIKRPDTQSWTLLA